MLNLYLIFTLAGALIWGVLAFDSLRRRLRDLPAYQNKPFSPWDLVLSIGLVTVTAGLTLLALVNPFNLPRNVFIGGKLMELFILCGGIGIFTSLVFWHRPGAALLTPFVAVILTVLARGTSRGAEIAFIGSLIMVAPVLIVSALNRRNSPRT